MNIEIADRLVKLRKKHNLSQEELANKLGISRQAVSKWERAEASPDTDNLITLARLYNVSLDELLYSVDDELDMVDKENKEKDSKITIDDNLISIKLDKDEKVYLKKRYNHGNNLWNKFPYTILMVIGFFLLGFIWDLWEYSWLLFLTVPLYYSLGTAIKYRDMNKFAYPVLVTIVFLSLGIIWKQWGWAWIVYLTIPVYYGIASMFKK